MQEMQEQARHSSDQDDEKPLHDGEDRQTDRPTDREGETELHGDRDRETESTLLYYALPLYYALLALRAGP